MRVEMDERGFEEVLRERAGWLFVAAMRQLGERGMAEDAVQVVFILLARRAVVMKERERVAGWLFKTLGFTVRNFRRVEGRRRRRERALGAEMRNGEDRGGNELGEMVGRLDEAVGKLPEKYREAILLRFYREVGFEELAKRWGVKEAGARKRVERGLEMLRERLGEGVSGGAVSACVVVGMGEMPVGLVKGVVSAVVGGKVAVAANVLTAAKGVNAMMMAAKVKVGAGVLAVVMMLPLGVGVVRFAMGEVLVASRPAVGFTISKETTGVMGPVREDGTVDYVAAINERYSKGVTPENNAFVAWLEVEGAGEKAIWKKTRDRVLEMSGAKVTGKETPFMGYWEILEKEGIASNDPRFEKGTDEAYEATRGPWKAEDHPEIAKWLEGQKGFLDSMAVVWARPRYWGPYVANDGRTMMPVVLVSLGPIRGVGDALMARAMLRFGSGDFEGYFFDVVTIENIGRRLVSEPTLIGRLVGYAMSREASQAIGFAAGSGKLTAEQCGRLRKELDSLEPLGTVTETMEVCERWAVLDMVMLLATGKTDIMKQEIYRDDPYVAFAKLDRGAVNWDAVMRKVNTAFDEVVLGLKGRELRSMKLATDRALEWKAVVGDLSKQEGESAEAYTDRVGDTVLKVFGFSVGGAEEIYRVAVMREEMARVVVAAGMYKAEKGNWPEMVEELVPAYLGKVPEDVYSRGEMGSVKYVVGEKGVMVYSVGKNGVDEGGVWDPKTKRDDVVVGVEE